MIIAADAIERLADARGIAEVAVAHEAFEIEAMGEFAVILKREAGAKVHICIR